MTSITKRVAALAGGIAVAVAVAVTAPGALHPTIAIPSVKVSTIAPPTQYFNDQYNDGAPSTIHSPLWGNVAEQVTQRYGCTRVQEDQAAGSAHGCPSGYQYWHHGIDVGLGSGTQMYAGVAGNVKEICNPSGARNGMSIVTANGNIIYLIHGTADAGISVGDPVTIGEAIYHSDNNVSCWGGSTSGPHLHLEVHTSLTFVQGGSNDDINSEAWLQAYPNGSLIHVTGTSSSTIYRQVGGAAMLLTSCSALTGNCTAIEVPNLGGFAPYPADGSFLEAVSYPNGELDNWYRVVGGAPLWMGSNGTGSGNSCWLSGSGCSGVPMVNQGTVDSLYSLRAQPPNRTYLWVPDSGWAGGEVYYRFAGGAPLHLTYCEYLTSLANCQSSVQVRVWTLNNPDGHLTGIPSDQTFLEGVASGVDHFYTTAGGAALRLDSPCSTYFSWYCANLSVQVNEATATGTDHLYVRPILGEVISDIDQNPYVYYMTYLCYGEMDCLRTTAQQNSVRVNHSTTLLFPL